MKGWVGGKREVVVVGDILEEEVDVEGAAEQVSGPGEAKEAQFSLVEGGSEIRSG